jgi:hypothetical protein
LRASASAEQILRLKVELRQLERDATGHCENDDALGKTEGAEGR